jgi:Glycosyltransferase family 87
MTSLHVVLAIGFAASAVHRAFTPNGIIDSDFTVFRSAWWLILHGQGTSLYDASAQRAAQHLLMGERAFAGGLMSFLNPPHAALAGVPLGWVAEQTSATFAFAFWTIANVVLLFRLDFLARQVLRAERGERRWIVTFAILAFYPVIYTISIGQLSLLLAVGTLELLRAVERGRPGAAAVWLIVLSVKPQLLPPLVVLLAVRGCWRTLGAATAFGIAVGGLSTLALGASIWFDYLRNLHELEGFFAAGTPAYMMNVRGMLTRVLTPVATPAAIYAVSVAAWVAAMAALVLLLVHRRNSQDNFRADFALTLAVGLFFNPHLFPQDTVIWIVALVLQVQALREEQRPWQPFAAFALCWPLVFTVSRSLDASGDALLRVTPVSVVMAIALVVMVNAALTTRVMSAGMQGALEETA